MIPNPNDNKYKESCASNNEILYIPEVILFKKSNTPPISTDIMKIKTAGANI